MLEFEEEKGGLISRVVNPRQLQSNEIPPTLPTLHILLARQIKMELALQCIRNKGIKEMKGQTK